MADFSAKHYQIKSEKNATRAEEAADRAEVSASNAEEAKNLANEAVTKLNSIDATVSNAKIEITSHANSAVDAAVVAIGNTASAYSKEIGYLNGVTSNIQTQLNNKLNASILSTNGLYCTTTVSGTQWSREWKDASGKRVWLEQGGRVGTRSGNGETTVTLPKAFSNTNYTVVQSNVGTYNENESGVIRNITTTSFGIFAWSGRGSTWYACGK